MGRKRLMSPFFVPRVFVHTIDNSTKSDDEWVEDPTVAYELTFVQRIFVLWEHHHSCTLATIILVLMGLNIVLSILVFIVASIPSYKSAPSTCSQPACDNTSLCPGAVICEPVPIENLVLIDVAVIVLFSVDYFIRLATCWTVCPRLAGLTDDPNARMSKPLIFLRYCLKFHSMIDFASILPFYFFLMKNHSLSGLSTGFVRVLRLPRLLQFIVNRDGVSTISALISILFRCLKRSMRVLLFTLYFYGIGIVLFATVILALEGGTFVVNSTYPTGAYLRDNAARTALEQTLFVSIPISIYYTIVTTTTLGYGDFTCQTIGGRAVACLLCFAGVIVLALPIAIIGSNFFDYYCVYLEKMKDQTRQREEEKTRLKLSFAADSINKVTISLKHEVDCSRQANSSAALAALSAAQDVHVKRALLLLKILKARPPEKEPEVEKVAFEEDELASYMDDIPQTTEGSDQDEVPVGATIRFAPFTAIDHADKVAVRDDVTWRETELELHGVESQAEEQDFVGPVNTYLTRGHSTLKPKKRNLIPMRLKKKLPPSWTEPRDYYFPWIVSSEYVYRDDEEDSVYKERRYTMSTMGRMYLLFAAPDSCKLATVFAWVSMTIILLGVVALIAQSVKSLTYTPSDCLVPACRNTELCPNATICAPAPLPSLQRVNNVVVYIFTIDYLTRLALSATVSARLAGLVHSDWDEKEAILSEKEKRAPMQDPAPYSWYYQMWLYSIKFYSVIDLISIFPYYFSFFMPIPSLVFFRILRLTRIVTLLKVPKSKEYAQLVKNTIKLSSSILMNLCFYVFILMVLFGCLMYVVEMGEFQVSKEYPNGAYMRADVGGFNSVASPFRSIPDAIYFVVITSTTIGFGDLYPTSQVGRFLSCVFVYCGILITAFPIAVIGQNFVAEYTKMVERNSTKHEEERNIIIKDDLIQASITNDMIILESRMLLKTLLSDASHNSKRAVDLGVESMKLFQFAHLLKQVASNPADWEIE